MDTVLHTKYRPTKFKEVIGQEHVAGPLTNIIKRDSSHAFLFSGPSGCGKTTFAYICAHKFGCEEEDILDIDAATYTGVENMRGVKEIVQFKPLSGSGVRIVLVDECHMLSRAAWNSLLKILEKPPAHVYWFFCTTEPGKVPPTIKTRCTSFTLKAIKSEDIEGRLVDICEAEGIDVPDDVLTLVVREAQGSMRQALVNLEVCRDARTKKEAAASLSTVLDSDQVGELCRFLMKGGSWAKAMHIVEKLKDNNPESVRIVVMNYMAAALRKETNQRGAGHILSIMDCFSQPYNPSERDAPLLLSVGRVLLGE